MTLKTYLKSLRRNHEHSNDNIRLHRSNVLWADWDNCSSNRMVQHPGEKGEKKKRWLGYQKKNRQGGMVWTMPTAC